MKKYLLLFVSCALICGDLSAQTTVTVYPDDYYDEDGYDDSEVVWVGPGLYYGLYFSTRPDYYAWRRRNLYYHRYYHYGYRRYHYHYYDRRYRGGRHYHRRRSYRRRGGRSEQRRNERARRRSNRGRGGGGRRGGGRR